MAETAKKNMVEDLAKAQQEIAKETFPKTGKANYGKFTPLDVIHEKALPIINKYNLFWTTMPSYDHDTGQAVLKYALRHTSGESIEGEMLMYLTKQDPQGQGSGITYARRYAITAVLGITADEDDDGQHANKTYAQDKEAPRQLTGASSVKQQDTVKDMMRSKGIKTKGDAVRLLKIEAGVTTVEDLTKQQASDLITKLKSSTPEEVQGAIMAEEMTSA